MTVRELKEKLNEYSDDIEVGYYDYSYEEGGYTDSFTKIEFDVEENMVILY